MKQSTRELLVANAIGELMRFRALVIYIISTFGREWGFMLAIVGKICATNGSMLKSWSAESHNGE